MTNSDFHRSAATEHDVVAVPKIALAWLFGEAPAPDGNWFGDDEDIEIKTPRKYSRKFWWRTRFRKLMESSSKVEPAAHNGPVAGSSPASPTTTAAQPTPEPDRDLELIIERALLDDEYFGNRMADQEDLEAQARSSAILVAEAIRIANQAKQPPAAPVETDPAKDELLDIEEGFDAGEWNNPPGTEPCKVCGGSGFSGRGTGYDDVCGECGGLKCLPVQRSSAATVDAAQMLELADQIDYCPDNRAEECLPFLFDKKQRELLATALRIAAQPQEALKRLTEKADEQTTALDQIMTTAADNIAAPNSDLKMTLEFIHHVAEHTLAVTRPQSKCDGADDLEHLDGMLDDRERGA